MHVLKSSAVWVLASWIAGVASVADAQVEGQPAEEAAPAQPAEPAPQPQPQAPAPAPQPESQPQPVQPEPPQPQPAPQEQPQPSAGEPPPPPTYQPLGTPEKESEEGDWDPWEHAMPSKHRHDGFFLRLSIGVGGGRIAGDEHTLADIGEVVLSGAGFGTSIGIGGALVDNLILNADLFQSRLFNPSVEIDGADAGDADELNYRLGVGDDAELSGLGIGVTWYIMPINIYLAGSVGLGQVVFEDGSGDREGSDIGFALNAMVGKEWWVGVDWGIGVAGQALYVRAEDDILGSVNGLALNLMFSATYN